MCIRSPTAGRYPRALHVCRKSFGMGPYARGAKSCTIACGMPTLRDSIWSLERSASAECEVRGPVSRLEKLLASFFIFF